MQNLSIGNIIGRGNTAEVLPYGTNSVCKLFFAGYPESYAWLEYQNALFMKNYALPVPQAYGLVHMNERIGIVYEYIQGTPLDRMFSNAQTRHQAIHLLVRLHQKLLSCQITPLPISSLITRIPKVRCIPVPYQEYLIESAHGQMESTLEAQIRSLPPGNSLCHGDYHPGNILLTSEERTVVIDFMNVCRGPKEFDIARTYFLLKNYGSVCENYLEKMGATHRQIEPYLSVIQACRKYGV